MKDNTWFSRGKRGLSRFFLIFFKHFLPGTVSARPKGEKRKGTQPGPKLRSHKLPESGRILLLREVFFVSEASGFALILPKSKSVGFFEGQKRKTGVGGRSSSESHHHRSTFGCFPWPDAPISDPAPVSCNSRNFCSSIRRFSRHHSGRLHRQRSRQC
jgi:hypothetical protein